MDSKYAYIISFFKQIKIHSTYTYIFSNIDRNIGFVHFKLLFNFAFNFALYLLHS